MVRPEPRQSLDEAELGAERGLDARLGLVEIDLLRNRDGLIARRGRSRHSRPNLGGGGIVAGCFLAGLLLRGALGLPCRPLCPLELEGGARGRAAGQQILLGNAADAGAIQLGEQRAAGIRRNGCNRTGARTDAEPVQRQRSRGFRIKGHASMSFRAGRDAIPTPDTVRDGGVNNAASRLSRS